MANDAELADCDGFVASAGCRHCHHPLFRRRHRHHHRCHPHLRRLAHASTRSWKSDGGCSGCADGDGYDGADLHAWFAQFRRRLLRRFRPAHCRASLARARRPRHTDLVCHLAS